jgi:muconolactone delta-isomerase
MRFMTLSRRRAELCCDVDFHRRLEAEASVVRDLRRAGIIRQIWHRGDAPGECMLIEAQSEEAARAVLELSPLIRAGLFEIDTIVPLSSYDSYAG